MLKLLIVVAVVFATALGFHWLKDTSGEVTLTLGSTAYAVDLTIAVIVLLAVILVTMGLIWFVQELLRAPTRLAFGWRRRNLEQGRAAVSQGLIAVAAGDLRGAERAMLAASRRTPDQPLARLLEAQTAQLKGDRAAARQVFQRMTEDPQTRIAGLRGLYVEAEREGEAEAARLIAEKAREESPSSPWAARALLRHQTAVADWDGALQTLSGAADGRVLDKRTARRHRAVILTALALDREDRDPDAARHAALEAHELAPDLVPAAVVAGRLLSRQGDIRRATRLLETTWKATPHPELADAYLHVRAGDSAGDRLKRAETLLRLRPHAEESRLALARAAIDARDFARAREALNPVLTSHPTQKALFLVAELEEQESGNRGRSREWLARAARAPRDAVWTADGVILEAWAPASPVTGRIDTVEWKVPIAELEAPRFEIDAAELEPPPPEPEPEPAPVMEIGRASYSNMTDTVAADTEPGTAAGRASDEAPFPIPPPASSIEAESSAAAPAVLDDTESRREVRTNGAGARIETEGSQLGHLALAPVTTVAAEHATDTVDEEALQPPVPDDPGVSEEDDQEPPARRFRIL